MRGFLPLLVKEFTEIARTWRIWIAAGAFVIFGLADPLIARFTNQILGSVVGDQLPIELPDPTYLDAYAQFTKDLSQLLIVVVLVIAAASVAGEVSSGTAIMPLTKPISRPAFVLAKLTTATALTAVSLVLGTALTSAITAIVFPDAQYAPLWKAAGIWLVLAVFLIAVTLLGSCLVGHTMAAFGIGFGGYLLLIVAGIWQPARFYSPAGLSEAIGLLAHDQDANLGWPVATALIGAAALVLAAMAAFKHREL